MRACLIGDGRPALAARLDDVVTARTASEVAGERFDVAVAFDWRATAHLFGVDAARHVYRVDGFAHHAMGAWDAARVPATLSYDLPVDVIAAGDWIAETLAKLRPATRCLVVPDGADDVAAATPAPGALNVLLTDPAGADGEALGHMSATAHAVERLGDADVLLRLDPADTASPALLRAMRAGVVPVVLPGGGQAGLLDHLAQGVVADVDDPRGAARWLDRLAGDRGLLARLREGARARAAAWPTHDQAAERFAAALEQLVATEPPPDARWPERLMGDAMAAAALWHNDHHRLAAALREAEREAQERGLTRLDRARLRLRRP